jgi:hypothetical protein
MKLTTKLLLVALSCAAGLLVGAFFSNSLKRKRDFFSELLSFIDSVTNDILFRQDGIRAVASSFQGNCKSKLKSVLEEYSRTPDVIPSFSFLAKGESRIVSDFFSGLGKADLNTEKSELSNVRCKVEEFDNFYKEKCRTRCSMFLKLGLLAGLAFGILIL